MQEKILLLDFDILCKPLIENDIKHYIFLKVFNNSITFNFSMNENFISYCEGEKFTDNYMKYLSKKIGKNNISEFYRYSTIGDFKLYLKSDIKYFYWINTHKNNNVQIFNI